MQGVRSLYSSHMHESLSISKSLNDLSALYIVHLDKIFELLWVPFLKPSQKLILQIEANTRPTMQMLLFWHSAVH